MKTINLTLSALLTLGIALTGCNQDENLPGTDADGRVALQVSSGIQTRAVGNQWEAGDQIGIFMLKPGTDKFDTYRNLPYKTTGTNNIFLPDEQSGGSKIYLPEDYSKVDFIAYYPWSKELDGDVENPIYPINLTNQNEQNKIDFMMADKVTGRSRRDYKAAFGFNHKLAKIEMEIHAGAGIIEPDLTGLTVKLTNQPLTGSFDLLKGTEVTASNDAAQDMELKVAPEGTSAEAIVFPSEDYEGMYFNFETKTKGTYSWKLTNSNADPKKFVAGHKYIYKITVKRTTLEVTATIKDWEPGNGEGDTGVAE